MGSRIQRERRTLLVGCILEQVGHSATAAGSRPRAACGRTSSRHFHQWPLFASIARYLRDKSSEQRVQVVALGIFCVNQYVFFCHALETRLAVV